MKNLNFTKKKLELNHRDIVLITGNPLNHEGGMVTFNKGLISTLNTSTKSYQLQHFSIGSRMSLFYYPILKRLVYPFLLIFDIGRLCLRLLRNDVRVVQLNPSLIPVPLFRDAIVQFINILFFKKDAVIVLHGWKPHVFRKIKTIKIYSFLVRKFFNSAKVIFVLSQEFKNQLIELGIDSEKIKVTTTFFYKEEIVALQADNSNSKRINFIYLGRVSKLKGIGELIEALKIVSKTHQNFTCSIIGHGDKPKTMDYYKSLILNNKLNDKIEFLGRKEGVEKFQLLNQADIYIFPSYMEGCPTSVIEALASGLFIISTDVGALNDIINDNNGIKVKPKQIIELADAIVRSIKDVEKLRLKKKKIADDAFINYEVTQIAEQFHKVYYNLIQQEQFKNIEN